MPFIQCDFFSQALQFCTSINVILPLATWRGKPTWKSKPVPTLYLLHGLSDDHTIWQRRTSIERYVEARNLAVVMPAVHRGFYTDMAMGYKYWTFVSQELPFVARSLFHLSAERDDNFVAGLSMGGYGAFKLALACPEQFSAAASLSGALDMASSAKNADPAWQVEYRRIFGEPDAMQGGPNDLFHLAEQLAASRHPRPRLFQWCGTEDFLYGQNQRFLNHARSLQINVDYSEGLGGHEWVHWDAQIQVVLDWLQRLEV